MPNITIKVSDEVARWARLRAAEKNTSISRLASQMFEREMRQTDAYWKAYREWKRLGPIPGFDASKRASRDELYDRGR